MNNQTRNNFCFCTLALGQNYCNLASELAKDLEKYSPDSLLVVLTDKPEHFKHHNNVLTFKHRQQSIGCYHDKRFVIAKALAKFKSCVFIDADMRILQPIKLESEWKPGITARIMWTNIKKHNKNEFEIKLLENMAHKLDLDLAAISFVHECLFAVTRDAGKELKFLEWWSRVAPYFELNGYYRGEGHAIGLAAAKAGIKIQQDSLENIVFFKDKIEINKIKKNGTVDLSYSLNMSEYFVTQKNLEYPQRNLMQKIRDKLVNKIMYLRRMARLKMETYRDHNFYYK